MKAGAWNIAVVFGGTSMERDVSVATAVQVIRALRSRGHSVTAIDAARGVIDAEGEADILTEGVAVAPPPQLNMLDHEVLAALLGEGAFDDFDLVFLALHGGAGENGTVQTLFDAAGVCYTGTGPQSSAIAMNKHESKCRFRDAGIPTADWVMVDAGDSWRTGAPDLPIIVKPNSQGSTVGLTLVESEHALPEAIALAQQFDSEVMLERYVPGRELTVGVLDGAALSVGEIIPAHGGLFDYATKYQSGAAAEIFPADVSRAVTRLAQQLAERVSETLQIECYCRVDFRLDPDDGLWCLEANTLPGLTSKSLMPRSAAASGIDFQTLCERICELALSRGKAR